MTIEEILEGNALIAIFMGAEYERKKTHLVIDILNHMVVLYILIQQEIMLD